MSVVIPALDAGATIGRQLAALAAQASQLPAGSWELIVADNGSSDRTTEVAREFGARLPLRVVDASAQRGPSAARNVGARAASGQVIVFTDADDVVLDGWLATWFEWSRRHGRGIGAGTLVRSRTPSGCVIPVHMGLPYASSNNVGLDVHLFEELGGFDEARQTGEDADLSWRGLRTGASIECVPAYLLIAADRRGWAVFRRHFEYGRGDPPLYKAHRDVGAVRASNMSLLRSYVGLLARLPLLWHRSHRDRLLRQAGRRLGRLTGSLRARTWYP